MIYRFGDCELDTQRMTLQRAGQTIRTRPKVFQLIAYLLAHCDRVVSKDELCEGVWPEQFIHDATLGSTVRAARHAVGDTGSTQCVIQTRHGHGYRLIADVDVLSDVSAEPLPTEHPPELPDQATVEAIAPVSSMLPPTPPQIEVDQATILLVDDEITVIKRFEALLTPRNFKVLSALNGTSGLEQAQRERPDLILLDVMMPDINGFEVCRRLKEDPETQLIPIVLMTALSDVEDRIKGLEAGADDFLTKPVNRDELLARIRSSLRLKQTIDQKVEALQLQQSHTSRLPTAPMPLYLTITREGEWLTVDLAAPGSAVPRGQIPLEDHLIAEIDQELTRILKLGVDQAVHCPAEATLPEVPLEDRQTALQRLGNLIFSYLLPAPIRQWLAAAEPTDLFLRHDDDLVSVPWELAFDGQAFWASKFRIGRQMLSDQPSPMVQPRSESTSPLNMLIIADPSEHWSTDIAEARQLFDLLSIFDNLNVTMVGGKQLRKIDLLLSLGEYDLVHYMGQTVFDAQQPARSGWVLHENVLTISELSQLTHPPLLVFANACQHPATIDMPVEMMGAKRLFDIGHVLLQAGTSHYISQFCTSHHPRSIAFAADFYRCFLQGDSVGSALAVARQSARQSADPQDILWASFVHYGDPTFQLPGTTPHQA